MLKNLKSRILLLFFILIGFNFYSQETLTTAKKNYYSINKTHPEYFEVTAKYAQALLLNNKIDESFELLEKHIIELKNQRDFGNLSFLYAIQSIQYFAILDKPKSNASLVLANKYVNQTSNLEIKGYISYANGWISTRNESEINAVIFFLKAIEHYEAAKNSSSLARRKAVIYIELARIYSNWDDLELEEKFSKKALENALLQNDINTLFTAYMTIGHYHEKCLTISDSNNNSRDLSEENYLKAIELFDSNTLIYGSDLTYALLSIANLYLTYYPDMYRTKALTYTLKAKKIAADYNEPNHNAVILNLLAQISLKENKISEARNYFLEALKTLDTSIKKNLITELSIYDKLTELEEIDGNYKQALEYQKKLSITYKKIYDSKKLELSKRIDAEYEKKLQIKEYEKLELISFKKEQEIQLLNIKNLQKENEFNNLKLTQENQLKKLKLNELESQKKVQELRFAKLENLAKNNDIKNFKEKLLHIEQIKNFYVVLIIFFAFIIILIIYLYLQRTKSMKQKVTLFNLALHQEKQKNKISILTALLEGQEKERSRLARDLHDSLGGLLSATKLQLSEVSNNAKDEDKSEINNVIEHIDYAVVKLRKISHNLMPELLIKFGLEVAIKEFALRMQNNHLKIDTEFINFNTKLKKDKELFVYRIIQELVSNAIKHANANQILIQMIEDENFYHITVEDDGKGFELDDNKFKNSAGFHNIQSRIEFLKGTLNIHSEKNKGTSIEFNFQKK